MNSGEIWQTSFDPALGGEIQKVRRAIIVSRDSMGVLPLRLVVPLTGWQAHFGHNPWMVRIEADAGTGLAKPSAADTFQLKSVSVKRLLKRLGVVSPAILTQVCQSILLVVGD